MTSDTPRVDAVPDWNARCGAQDDEKIITHGDLLALAHDEADELRELASTLERKLNEARAEVNKLRGECSVLADVLLDAAEVMKVIEADDSDEHESLWQLNYAIATALAPYKPIPKDSVESEVK